MKKIDNKRKKRHTSMITKNKNINQIMRSQIICNLHGIQEISNIKKKLAVYDSYAR
jgi:hypothetical protein